METRKRKNPSKKGISPGAGLWSPPRLSLYEKNITKRPNPIQKKIGMIP
jgi:hypothetical protein